MSHQQLKISFSCQVSGMVLQRSCILLRANIFVSIHNETYLKTLFGANKMFMLIKTQLMGNRKIVDLQYVCFHHDS